METPYIGPLNFSQVPGSNLHQFEAVDRSFA